MKTHYRLDGPDAAPVVTLTHPLGATLALWDDHVPALSKRYRVLRYDVRGHGGSGTHMAIQWSPERRQRLEWERLRPYHAALTGVGVSGDDFDALWLDYRRELREPDRSPERPVSARAWTRRGCARG